ncbi:MAG: DnaB-like helicase N-terminal domain-containing protein, partial [Flammeovirgaceae bacterium]
MFSKANPIDILTVTIQLRSTGELEIAGGSYYITELTSKVNSATNLQYHIQIVKQKWIQRLLIKVSSKNIEHAYEDTKDVFELLEKSSMELLKLNQQLAVKKAETGKHFYFY